MSGSTAKATRRDIRRAFGADAVATVAALDTRLRQAEAEIVALKIENARLGKLHVPMVMKYAIPRVYVARESEIDDPPLNGLGTVD